MAGAFPLSLHVFYDRRELFCPRILSFRSVSCWVRLIFWGSLKKGLPKERRTRISWDLPQAKPKMETQGKYFDLVFREITSCFRFLTDNNFSQNSTNYASSSLRLIMLRQVVELTLFRYYSFSLFIFFT